MAKKATRKRSTTPPQQAAPHKAPAKTGRPSSYRPEYAEQAQKLCRFGATDADLADFFGVTEQTVNNWKDAHPEFFESLNAGKDVADERVVQSLYQRALGYSHSAVKIFANGGDVIEAPYTEHYPPDTTACIFWLKNRRKDQWRDKQDVEHSGHVTLEEILALSQRPA